MEKRCVECGEVKPLEDFYKHPMMGDGHLNKCKSCVKARVKKYRQNNLDTIRAYDRMRGSTSKRMEKVREYQSEHKQTVSAAKLEWSRRNREKRNAQQRLLRAVKNGTLVRATRCDLCNAPGRIEAHHPDYSKPLEVLWLCDPCHKKIHNTARENARKASGTVGD